jgi:hypothetical protein
VMDVVKELRDGIACADGSQRQTRGQGISSQEWISE